MLELKGKFNYLLGNIPEKVAGLLCRLELGCALLVRKRSRPSLFSIEEA